VRIAVALLFAAVLAAFFALGGHRYLSLDAIKENRDTLLAFTHAHFVQAVAIAFAVFAATTAFTLPSGILLCLAFGFLFGRWIGTAIVVLAGTIGATLLFLTARYVIADSVRKRLGKVGERINAGFTQDAFSYMLFLRLVPAFPYAMVSLAPALTTIPLRTYALATFIGTIPGAFVFVNLGETLGRIDWLEGLISWETFAATTLLGLLALVPVVYRRATSRRAGRP
jgi:uncharacterized membrane protein YdjX (TVP38/TMEM64 family)